MKNMFVITHKNVFYKLKPNYEIIKVGNNEIENVNYLNDNTRDNIASKNQNYCELTALYWLWKNYDLPKYIGICHYRRFFVKKPFFSLIDEKYINKALCNYNIILPYKYKTGELVKEHFINGISGRKEDIDRLEKLIKEKYSDYYEDFKQVMNGEASSYWNMFVTTKEIYKNYCEWLFGILFEFEKTTDLTGYSSEEARIYGYLSEFLLNVWVNKNKLRVKYVDVLLVKDDKKFNFLKKIQVYVNHITGKVVGE